MDEIYSTKINKVRGETGLQSIVEANKRFLLQTIYIVFLFFIPFFYFYFFLTSHFCQYQLVLVSYFLVSGFPLGLDVWA